jgi:hypothetical protein
MLPLLLSLSALTVRDLPVGPAPKPVAIPHFPDRVHAFVWRNWSLVPADRLAKVLSARPEEVLRMGRAMGLSDPPRITADLQRRSYLTVIRRNWHVLPYDQLLTLLGWTEKKLAFTLREDDFLYIKLGSLKPACEPLRYTPPDERPLVREREIASIVRAEFPEGVGASKDPLFSFVKRLSAPPTHTHTPTLLHSRLSPRFCYSYFALYGDPLLEKEADPYPDGYLARMAAAGVDGVWLQAVLYKLAPFPWDAAQSQRYEDRLKSLRTLVARAKKHGIGVYLYFNEPRAMPLSFFDKHPELKGVIEGDHATLCTSVPAVKEYVRTSVASICRAVPDLAGFFTITASENLTNCWSHHRGTECPRCSKRPPAEVIAEVNGLVQEGIRQAGSKTKLIAWDWGWNDAWAQDAIARLPQECALMSVSEWSIPIKRGGTDSVIGEYSLSEVGPGPRATKHWALAKQRGLKTIAKIQAANSWELSTVPYIPALENTAQHAANLQRANVDGLMLGWTLGGYPSPNLEVVREVGNSPPSPAAPGEGTGVRADHPTTDTALLSVARRRFGEPLAPTAVQTWKEISQAFREYPYHISVVYSAPVQLGPANLLWELPTKFPATMVGFPYDDLDQWRGPYPPAVFAAQLDKCADGFMSAVTHARRERSTLKLPKALARAFDEEMNVAEACAIHFRSVANQARFVVARRALAAAKGADQARGPLADLQRVLTDEIAQAKRLLALQSQDSRIGFEASNQYAYVSEDLVEKVLNCRDLLDRWLAEERMRLSGR